MKAELSTNLQLYNKSKLVPSTDLSASFVKDKDGDIHCVYEASDKKAFDIAKNEFKKIHEEVSRGLEIENKEGFTVIKDTVSGKEISFDEILSKEQLKKVIEEDFGYSGVKAELAANKFGNTLSAEEQQKFLQDKPFLTRGQNMYEVNSLEYDIKLENENILLNDFSFININLKKDGVNQIVVMDNKNETAAAFSPDLKQSDIEEILRVKIGITDTATITAITDKIEKVYDIYETKAQGNMSMDISQNKIMQVHCEIERKNKNEFEVKINGKISSYSFNDKLDSLINIRRELMKAGDDLLDLGSNEGWR